MQMVHIAHILHDLRAWNDFDITELLSSFVVESLAVEHHRDEEFLPTTRLGCIGRVQTETEENQEVRGSALHTYKWR